MLTFLASGQSNMVGSYPGGDWTISPKVKVWNATQGLNDLTKLGTAWVTPELGKVPFEKGNNNLAAHAANQIARYTGQDVRLVLVSKGAQSIISWYNNGNRSMVTRILAVLAAAGVTSVDGFFWHQGESDNSESHAAYYTASWNGIVSTLTNAGVINSTTPIIMPELTASKTRINTVIKNICAADARAIQAPIKRFVLGEDNTHLIGSELVRVGLVYAALWRLLHG